MGGIDGEYLININNEPNFIICNQIGFNSVKISNIQIEKGDSIIIDFILRESDGWTNDTTFYSIKNRKIVELN